MIQNREKYGIKIPNSVKAALAFDHEAGHTKWADAIAKEMTSLDQLLVFKYHPSTTIFQPQDGWQRAPLRMIFDIKQEDLRFLVCGGHRVDSSGCNTFSSTVSMLSIRLLSRHLIFVKQTPR
jgi:hypothetical protein